MADAARMRHAAPAMILALALSAVPGIAEGQAQTPELFSAVPPDMPVPEPLNARDAYSTGSEMVVLNAEALAADSLTASIMNQTHVISRDLVETWKDGSYTWYGSGGQGERAVLVVDGTTAIGVIHSQAGTFEILPVSGAVHEVYRLDMSAFPPISDHSLAAAAGARSSSIDRNLISQLESAYEGWREYDDGSTGTVTIDVYVAVTDKAVTDYIGYHQVPVTTPSRLAQLAVGTANMAYETNELPIRLNLVDRGTPFGYVDAGNLTSDLDNLTDTDNRLFNLIRFEIEEANADVAVMLVGDYMHTEDDNNDKQNTCGVALQPLAGGASTAFGAVESVCLAVHSFTGVVGRLQGAGYNVENGTNSEFGYAHGHYNTSVDRRTVMSQSVPGCDDPLTSKEEVCRRVDIWSDPHRYFFGTQTPAGTVESWNARALFATGPHIASIRGDAQNYDSVRPTGNVTLPDVIPTRGTLQINATFSEPIHDRFPPVITITDGVSPTAAVMTKSSETEYTYSHLLDGERGTFQILFSNARDLFGNPVVKAPTSGGSFAANAEDAPPHPPPTEDAVHSVSEDFEQRLDRSMWRLLGDGTWLRTVPTDGVPDEPISSNRVMASDDCEDSCILLLNPEIDTSEPLMISFDRYVGGKIDRDEGLHVEYSTDRTTWNTLASFTDNGGHDTGRWERSVIGITIPENWAKLRFNAMSDTAEEYVEIDNLVISRPEAVVPDVTFTAETNESRNGMILTLSKSTSHEFSRSNFVVSHAAVSSVQNLPNSSVRHLTLAHAVPYDTPVTVKYYGRSVDLGGGAILHTGTSAVAIPVPSPDRPPVISMISDVSVAQGGTETRQVTSFDPDGDAITLSVSEGPDFVTIADAGDGSGTVTISPTLASHVGSHTVTVEAASNSLTAVTAFAVTVTGPSADTTPPTVTAPGDVTAEATGALTAVSIGRATATDDRDPSPDITDDAPESFPLGITTVTWTATDDAGNSATATQTVTVRDTTPPTVTVPADHTAEATGAMTPLDAGDYGTATATDLADPNPKITSNAPGSFPVGDTVITWTATDDAGNSATATQTVTVRDTTPPAITAPSAYTAEATGSMTELDADDYGTATATDLVDSDPEITSNAPDSFPIGTTAITWTATDDSGNSATATQTVTVRQTVQPDTTAPEVTAPADVTAEATGTLTAVSIGQATATDDRDPDPAVTSNAPASFPVGDTEVTWTATDDAGNSATATQTVTVRDTAPPAVTAPADHVAEATGAMTALDAGDYGTATATDLADPDPEVTSDAPLSFHLGNTTVTWTATDASGNSANATQTVTVRDTTPPAIAAPPDIEVIAPPDANATVYFAAPEATDLADPDVAVSCAPESGSEFPAGSTAVACTATDASGNGSSASFDVRVTVPAGQDVLFFDFEFGRLDGWTKSGGQRWHADGPAERRNPPGYPVHNRVAEADGCWTECIITLASPVDMTLYNNETLTFYRYVDDDLDGSEYLRLDAFDGSSWEELGRWTPEDSDDDDRWHRERYALDAYTDTGAFKIRFAANMSSLQEQVAIDDIMLAAVRAADAEPPDVTAPPDAAFEATAPLTPLDAGDYGAATATDGSGAPPQVTSDAPASFPVGDTVITWTATDASGNTATAAQTVTVRDTTPPAFAPAPQDLTFVAPAGGSATADFAVPDAADIADPDVDVSCTPAPGTALAPGTTAVACTAADASGNESRVSFDVRAVSSDGIRQASARGSHGGAGWTVTGPGLVFPGETYEYTVTLDKGTAPPREALSMHSDTSTADDFGLHVRIQDCQDHFCAGFPGPTHAVRQLENPGGSAYDHYLQPVSASDGPVRTITLEVGDSAPAGGRVGIGLLDAGRNMHVGVQATVVDPAVPLAADTGGRLVSHLAFEGDVRDSAGSSHGTVNGTAAYADGAVGRAFHFDGSTHVTLAGEGSFDFELDDPFSAAFWFKRDGPDDRSYYILSKRDAGGDRGPAAWIWDPFPGRIHLRLETGTAFMGVNTMGANLTDGTWHHVAFTYDGSGTRGGLAAYVDGIEGSDRRGALSLNGTMASDAPLVLGALGSGSQPAREAAMDELRVYSRGLTASEVLALYAEGAG